MTMNITSIDASRPDFAGLVTAIDLRQPLRAEDVATIEAGMNRYGVLVFRGQDLSNEQQVAFTRNFGPLEEHYFVPGDNVQAGRVPSEINDISNLDRNRRFNDPGVFCERAFQPSTRCFRRAQFRTGEETRSSPTCGRRGTRWTRKPRRSSAT